MELVCFVVYLIICNVFIFFVIHVPMMGNVTPSPGRMPGILTPAQPSFLYSLLSFL